MDLRKIEYKTLIKVGFAVLIFWSLIHTAQIKFELIIDVFHHPVWLTAVIILFYLMIFVGAARWYLLNSAQGMNFSFRQTLMPTYLGAGFNNLLPGAVGGDFVRLYYLFKKIPDKKSSSVISVLFDRLTGFVGVVMTIFLAAIYHAQSFHDHPALFYLLCVSVLFCMSVLIAFAALMIILHYSGLTRWLNRHFSQHRFLQPIISFLDAAQNYKFPMALMCKCLFMSILMQLLITSTAFLIAYMMNFPPISFLDYALAISITQIVNLIPVTPGGIGIGEMAFVNVLLLLNPTASAPFATIFLTYRLLNILAYLPGVVSYIPSLILLRTEK